MKYRGLGVALITPFDKNENIDFDSLKKLVNKLITNKVDYLVVLGTTGESVTLTKEEKQSVINTVLDENNGKLPVVVGIGGNNTQNLINEIKGFDFTGIDAILSVSPYYNKPNQNGIYNHYAKISEVCPVDIILYNVPGRTGSNISAETTIKLAHDFENIVAIKEASGNLEQISEIILNKPEKFLVISGDDALAMPQIAMGMDGVISVIANAYPGKFSEMVHLTLNSENHNAQKIHFELFKLIQLIFSEGSPAGVKALMNLMNECELIVRPPLYPQSEEGIQKLKKMLK
jgi:4-hydroxy-tetrahydrodipicolinate synthase